MIVDDNSSHHSSISSSKLNNQTYLTQNYINFFNCHPSMNNSFYIKDPVFDLGYIPSNPFMILESNSYTLIGELFIEQIHLESIQVKKFFSFVSQASIFVLLYNERQITIYSLSKNYFSESKYETITLNSQGNSIQIGNDESIVQMQTIKNEQDIPYFILVTNKNRVLCLTISLRPFGYQFTEVKPKSSIVSSVFSYLSFYANNTSNKIITTCDILNPLNYTKMTKGNKKNNCLIILSDSNIKMINFDIFNQLIIPELSLDHDIHDAVISNINDYCKSYSIISSDVYNNFSAGVIQINFLIKTANYNYYLIRINVDENKSITYQHLNITQYFDNTSSSLSFTACLLLNKYQDEGIIITGSFLVYLNKNSNYSFQFNHSIKGVNPLVTPNNFSIDILSESNGVRNVKAINNTFTIREKTDEFLRKFRYDGQMVSNIKKSNMQTSQMDNNSIHRSIISNIGNNNKSIIINNVPNSLQASNSFKVNESIQINTSSIISVNNSITVFLKEKFNEFLETNKITNESRNEMDELFQKTKHEAIYKSIQDIIMTKMNDDTLNIENINRSNYKAEFVIVEYLEAKFVLVSKLFDFLLNYDVFTKYEQSNHDILILLLNTMEKLIVLINIRRQENAYIEKSYSNQSTSFRTDDDIVLLFLDKFYQSMKDIIIPTQNDSKPFSKQYLYGRLSHINASFLMNFFDKYQNTYRACQHAVKTELTNFCIELINVINFNLIDHYKDISIKLNNNKTNTAALLSSQRDVFWSMSKVNLDENMQMVFNNGIELNKNRMNIMTDIKEQLMSYCEKMLYFYDMYYSQNNTAKDKRDYYETKKKIINSLLNDSSFNECLTIAKEFDDYYNIAFICYKWKLFNELKSYLNSKQNNKVTLFILKQSLLFEFERIKDFKSNNEHYITFDFFDTFHEYHNEIGQIVAGYPKLKLFFNVYLNQLPLSTADRNKLNNDRDSIDLLSSKITLQQNMANLFKIEKTLSLINKSIYVDDINIDSDYKNNINNEQVIVLQQYDARLNTENYAIMLANMANDFGVNVEKRNIFEAIPDIINSIITVESKKYEDIGDKYFIAMHLLLIGVGKLDSEYAHQQIYNIYQLTLEYDYKKIKESLKKYLAKTMENIFDKGRKQILRESITLRLSNAFPETRDEYNLVLNDFRDMNQNEMNEANFVVDNEKDLRLEFYNLVNKGDSDDDGNHESNKMNII